jgi:predicted metal-dependent phosphoesterase TrpH
MRKKRPEPARARLGGADLHVHTTHSDGLCSPGEVVRSAAAVGLDALAITDHDTMTALPSARLEADRLGIELIAGVELTAEADGREIHLLAYFVRDDDPALRSATDALRLGRTERLDRMIDLLNGLGLAVEGPRIREMFPRAALGRPHLAQYLQRTGQVSSAREAFARFLGDGGPAHAPKPRLAWDEAIRVARSAGGVVALAHPPYDLRAEQLGRWAEGGLGAIEVDGPGIQPRLGRRWRDWAERFNLVPVAGSDFHATGRTGSWVGSIRTPGADLEALRALRTDPTER